MAQMEPEMKRCQYTYLLILLFLKHKPNTLPVLAVIKPEIITIEECAITENWIEIIPKEQKYITCSLITNNFLPLEVIKISIEIFYYKYDYFNYFIIIIWCFSPKKKLFSYSIYINININYSKSYLLYFIIEVS